MTKHLFIILLLVGEIINAQNLVPNPSFEYHTSCPASSGQIDYAFPWYWHCASTDYYNSCDTLGIWYSVPNNVNGFCYAHSGMAYAGIVTYADGGTYREYIVAGLNDTLIANQEYCISFFVSLADDIKYGADRIGAYFSTDSVICSIGAVLPYIPQIENPSGNILADTSGWQLVQQSFFAAGGERFITIGNFRDDSNTSLTVINPAAPPQYAYAYYYVDDVSAVQGPCGVGIEEHETKSEIKIYPNPADGLLHITTNDNTLITIYDLQGRFIKSTILKNGEINISELEAGCYVLKVKNQHELITVK